MPTRPANAPELRVLRVLRQQNVITGTQMTDAITALEATEPCTRCNGTGRDPDFTEPVDINIGCTRCDGTGEQRVIR